MSTRALIAMKKDHVWVGIYLTNSTPDTLRILRTDYPSRDHVHRLMLVGNISSLGKYLYPTNNQIHTFNSPEPNVTVAYDRDRGESGQQSKMRATFARLREDIGCTSNTYIFKDGKWAAFGCSIEDGIDTTDHPSSREIGDFAISSTDGGIPLDPKKMEAILNAAAKVADNVPWIIMKLQKHTDRGADEELYQALRDLRNAHA